MDRPLIQTNYLSTAQDVADVYEGSHLLRRLASTEPLADIVECEHMPGQEIQTPEQVMEDFRARAGSVYHPTSTCAMGPERNQAVVDARLRVHGVSGLRVVDASVFPFVTSGNTNAPTLMVAEKGADMILQDQH